MFNLQARGLTIIARLVTFINQRWQFRSSIFLVREIIKTLQRKNQALN